MKKIVIQFLMWFPLMSFAHGGDDHGDTKKAEAAGKLTYFSSEAVSEKYELLVKYNTITPGENAALKLFVSEYNTNRPVDSATIMVTVVSDPGIKILVSQLSKGVYELKGIFPAKKTYNLAVNINSSIGADLIQVNNIEVGKEFVVPNIKDGEHIHWYGSNWFFGFAGLVIGLALMYFVSKRRSSKITTAIIILFCLLPSTVYNPVSAHEGEDHNGNTKSAGSSSEFIIEKETQFLFDIQTQKAGTGNFSESVVLLGTVSAAPQGRSVIQAPQTGKIVSLNIIPGQQVARGQTVAVIEQQIDAGTQISILSQSNAINAEYDAAKAQYERLKAIEDIAAKKEVTEAKARYETAKRNKTLFDANNNNGISSTKKIILTAPVSGTVSSFNYATGAIVNAGETLFEITNLDKIFTEVQVFANDAQKIKSAVSFTCVSNTNGEMYKLKLVNTAQFVNAGNQSQKVVFEILNPGGQFKIGENINVRMTGINVTRQLLIPSDAITSINGKPAVFIKDKAEQYSVSFVVTGSANEQFTIISKGVEDGERVVTTNVYQTKMVYLNQ
ncbi:MAG TPA: efflux RND transporter periplasmic adaptor subunit [Chitinophagaceae bacterium]|nr:efflux RND transporter periplasmic adaptor subunit [Chitinophagaceae bacterium]